ncbi:MAG: hypothetical protein ACP5RT_02525 [Candidatus Micrarchaeia archaeon]
MILPFISKMPFSGGLSLFDLFSLFGIVILLYFYMKKDAKLAPRIFDSKYLYFFIVITAMSIYMSMTYMQIYMNSHSRVAALDALSSCFVFFAIFAFLLVIIRHDARVVKHNNPSTLRRMRRFFICFEAYAMIIGYVFYAYLFPVTPKRPQVFLDIPHVFGAFVFFIVFALTATKAVSADSGTKAVKKSKGTTQLENNARNDHKSQGILDSIIKWFKNLEIAHTLLEFISDMRSFGKPYRSSPPINFVSEETSMTMVTNPKVKHTATDIKQTKQNKETEGTNQAKNGDDEVKDLLRAIYNRNVKTTSKIIQANPYIVKVRVDGKSIISIALEVCLEDIRVIKKEGNQVVALHIYNLKASVEILGSIYTKIKNNNFVIEQETIEYVQNEVVELEINTEYASEGPINSIIKYAEGYTEKYSRRHQINNVIPEIRTYILYAKKHKNESKERRKKVYA